MGHDHTYTTPAGAVLAFDDPALLAELLDQEQRLAPTRLDHDDAARLGSLVADLASERGLPVVVRVELETPDGPHTAYQRAFAGSTPGNDWWLERKGAVVRRFGHSSFAVGTRFRTEGTTFEESSGLDPQEFKAHGGAFPLFVGGALAGVLGVSGLPQQDDHALAVEGLALFASAQRATAS